MDRALSAEDERIRGNANTVREHARESCATAASLPERIDWFIIEPVPEDGCHPARRTSLDL